MLPTQGFWQETVSLLDVMWPRSNQWECALLRKNFQLYNNIAFQDVARPESCTSDKTHPKWNNGISLRLNGLKTGFKPYSFIEFRIPGTSVEAFPIDWNLWKWPGQDPGLTQLLMIHSLQLVPALWPRYPQFHCPHFSSLSEVVVWISHQTGCLYCEQRSLCKSVINPDIFIMNNNRSFNNYIHY